MNILGTFTKSFSKSNIPILSVIKEPKTTGGIFSGVCKLKLMSIPTNASASIKSLINPITACKASIAPLIIKTNTFATALKVSNITLNTCSGKVNDVFFLPSAKGKSIRS